MSEKNKQTMEFPLTLHHDENGEINKAWRNPNLFVTADSQRDDGSTQRNPIYTPLIGKMNDETDYFYVANVAFTGSNDNKSANPVIEFYYSSPAGGIRPRDLVPLGQGEAIMREGTFEVISNVGQQISKHGHLCLIAWIRTDNRDDNADQIYPSSIPLNDKGVVDANHPLVAQRNISVINVPAKGANSISTFQISIPEGVDEISIKRESIAEREDLMGAAGLANLVNEALDTPRMEIFLKGSKQPFAAFTAEALQNAPTLDMRSHDTVELTVEAELAEESQENAAAIYAFETPDGSEGVAIILTYNESEEPEDEVTAPQDTDKWYERIRKRMGQRMEQRMRRKFQLLRDSAG